MERQLSTTISEVLRFVEENDVKFIRLAFCDLFGCQKNISIMPGELEHAFSEGISFDASAVSGFGDIKNSDLFLRPDADTLSLLSWRPQQGRVARFYCNIFEPDGSPFALDGRALLKNIEDRCRAMGYECKIGAECEFYLFKTDENGEPTYTPLDSGGYFDMAPLDKAENVRREICLTLEDMGLEPESSHHEQGPGQNEIDFRFSDPLRSADGFMTFKTVVKVIAARNGLFASFLPKPIADKSGSGMHVNLSLSSHGSNIFADKQFKQQRESFIAGVLDKAREISLFLNPIPNSYKRLGKFEAPRYVSWSEGNRSQLIRIPAEMGKRSRIELRSADAAVNPYLAYALILNAGLLGMEKQLVLKQKNDLDLFTASEEAKNKLDPLPSSLKEAVDLARNSAFVKNTLGDAMFYKYISSKEKEAEGQADSDNIDYYFKII